MVHRWMRYFKFTGNNIFQSSLTLFELLVCYHMSLQVYVAIFSSITINNNWLGVICINYKLDFLFIRNKFTHNLNVDKQNQGHTYLSDFYVCKQENEVKELHPAYLL